MATATVTEYEQELDAQLYRLFSNVSSDLEVKGNSFTDMFKVLKVHGRGAEGKVYRAEDRSTGKTYTAKVVTCFTDSSQSRDVEAQIQAMQRLNHENIPKYVDCLVKDSPELHEKEYILLTEDVEGENLAQRWKRVGAMKDELAYICGQTLDALSHAHSQKVLHRDIKPENLIITEEGEVKVIDWGVAKIEGNLTRLTTVGVVGTAGYMAPEVIDGEKATSKSDIYSLGATLIAAARGKHPGGFDGSAEMKEYLSELKLGSFGKRLEGMVEKDPEKRKWEVEDNKEENQEKNKWDRYKLFCRRFFNTFYKEPINDNPNIVDAVFGSAIFGLVLVAGALSFGAAGHKIYQAIFPDEPEIVEETVRENDLIVTPFEGEGQWEGYKGYKLTLMGSKQLDQIRKSKDIRYVETDSDDEFDIAYVFDADKFVTEFGEQTEEWEKELEQIRNPDQYAGEDCHEKAVDNLFQFQRIESERIGYSNKAYEKLADSSKFYLTFDSLNSHLDQTLAAMKGINCEVKVKQ